MQKPPLEPAEVDPAKLRRTAWILVVIMVVGGVLVLSAYNKMAGEQSADNRPAIIHQIRKERDLAVVRQDGKGAEFFDLRGKVVAIHCMSFSSPEASRRSLEVMKRLAETAGERPDLHLVTLMIDPPPAEQTKWHLEEFSTAYGMELPLWWVATTEEKTIHKFIRSELKAAVPPYEEDGKWKFDTAIFLLDREGHLRRAVVPQQRGGRPYVATFDFDQAAEWDARGVKTGTELNNQEQLEKLLRETIDILLKEPTETS